MACIDELTVRSWRDQHDHTRTGKLEDRQLKPGWTDMPHQQQPSSPDTFENLGAH